MNAARPEAEKLLHGLYVPVILTQRILKLEPAVPMKRLRPLSRRLVSEDPACSVPDVLSIVGQLRASFHPKIRERLETGGLDDRRDRLAR